MAARDLCCYFITNKYCASILPAQGVLQPVAEAPLSGDTEFHCRFGQDNSTECVSAYRYTILTLAGGKVDASPLHCQVRSPRVDVDLDGKPAKSGYQYRYRSARKVSWFSHDEIGSGMRLGRRSSRAGNASRHCAWW